MTIAVDIGPEVEAELARQASMRGRPLEATNDYGWGISPCSLVSGACDISSSGRSDIR
jgi:hypothetical protein